MKLEMTTPSNSTALAPRLGFRHWMQIVLDEARNAESGFASGPVHDLRVAIRRCRSMADGLRHIDPDPAWSAMKRAGGRVFRSLGDLRDVQVMREWIQQLAPPGDPLAQILDDSLAEREESLKREAQTTLGRLDHGQWRKWADHLAARAARVPLGGAAFQYLALQRWHEARELQRLALRNRSQASWHALRIGIKRLRYTVENFLPEHHERWGKDLKALQDSLGEIHDFDVLWGHIRAYGFEAKPEGRTESGPDANSAVSSDDGEIISHWRTRIREERARRLEDYRKKMVGPDSLWLVWRAELPQGPAQHKALTTTAQTLAKFAGSNLVHVRHVTSLALQLYDGLAKTGILRHAEIEHRRVLELAAILQDVGHFRPSRASGRGKDGHGHHKRSYRMLMQIAPPPGWTAEEWAEVAALARYHRGAIPRSEHESYQRIPAAKRRRFLLQAAILRLANALDAGHTRAVRSLKVEKTAETILLVVAGYSEDPVTLPQIAIAKHLLEIACGLPLMIRSVDEEKPPTRMRRAA